MSTATWRGFTLAAILVSLATSHTATQNQPLSTGTMTELPSPAGVGSQAPNLSRAPDGRVFMTWLEPAAPGGAALRFAFRRPAGAWSEARTIASGRNWFVNAADVPSMVVLDDGTFVAHWLGNHPPGTEAADITIARSRDQGMTWSAPVIPHQDRSRLQHGFVTLVPVSGGLVHAIWLDGRHTRGEGVGDMALMAAVIAADGTVSQETTIDSRACECCPTSAVATPEGILVAYRDRSDQEVRDISVVRYASGRWSSPERLSRDAWTIKGCPVNGPSAAIDGQHAAVAWFTGATAQPRVFVALSSDAGRTFGPAIAIADGRPLGRVEAAVLPNGGAIVSWIETSANGSAQVTVRLVDGSGKAGSSVTAPTAGGVSPRSLPRIERSGREVTIAWTSAGPQPQVKTAALSVP